MTRSSRWVEANVADGVMDVQLTSWKYFYDYVRQEMLDFSHYVWRGQRDAGWSLESSLDRQLRAKPNKQRIAQAHLTRFKLAIRGRRGPNPVRIEDENEWWALGQHHGLATPLLDWTQSPFAALYFAFENGERPKSGVRSVWALSPVTKKNAEIVESHKAKKPAPAENPPILEFVRPHQDENARLVAQSGLFTKVPLGETIDAWTRRNYAGESRDARLIKIMIPELGRTECLRTLNTMNINHLSLFPDIVGASLHCNKGLEIDKY